MIDNYKKALEKKKYAFFTKGIYNVNIIGVRDTSDNNNLYNDKIALIYKDPSNNYKLFEFPATTDPGAYYLLKPIRSEGCAILAEGQYRCAYSLGLHKGTPALVQTKTVRVFRDANRDLVLDKDKFEDGIFGINIHKPFTRLNTIDLNSAGCQVFKYEGHFSEFLKVLNKSAKLYGNAFTYTLINVEDLWTKT